VKKILDQNKFTAVKKTQGYVFIDMIQGRSQMVRGVTVVAGPWAPGGLRRVPRGPRNGPRKKAARERAVKAKVDAVCLLEKRRK
jgi:hypothetical protein